ncbi:MAG TPA: hypothetical protein P5026_10155 [Kiritimatiellia bacterium]|jgi:hypothetical protein|nr:hypothetical protein [Kiritimatiellia bacterium]HRU69900.1 hypothetical protein [Kiritimatiellia bacterium]
MLGKAVVVCGVFAVASILCADIVREALPDTVAKPYVFKAEPNAFAGKPDARSFDFPFDGSTLFAGVTNSGTYGALHLTIRATEPDTRAVEVSLVQNDGVTWGLTSLPIGPDWQEIILPCHLMRPFTHWSGHPRVTPDARPDFRLVTKVRFCYGKWLCPDTLAKPHGFEIRSVKLVVKEPPTQLVEDKIPLVRFGSDHSLDAFPRYANETDDSGRFRRAIAATPSGVLSVPRGVYRIASPVRIANGCSLQMNKNAKLVAVQEMEYVLEIDGAGLVTHDYNRFLEGGCIDGAGLASCMRLARFSHFTLRDATFLNGRAYGLRMDGGYELIANNLYFKCVIPGLAGNSGVYVNGGDSHYTDCVVVDYTIGFNVVKGGSNRLTRCHVWGGPLPPAKPGEPREMLKDSINFRIAASSTILRDCYADTGKIGFEVGGWDTRLLGCSYFNNKRFGLDGITIIKHLRGRLLVTDGGFVKNTPNVTVYEGCGEVEWANMMYSGFGPQDDCPGALKFQHKSATEQKALKLAD